jgi:hypothetical protein
MKKRHTLFHFVLKYDATLRVILEYSKQGKINKQNNAIFHPGY